MKAVIVKSARFPSAKRNRKQEKKAGRGENERGSRRGGVYSRICIHRISDRLRVLYVSFNIKENAGSGRNAEKADQKV